MSCVVYGTTDNLLDLQNVSLQFLNSSGDKGYCMYRLFLFHYSFKYYIFRVICCRMLSFWGDSREYFQLNRSESLLACSPLLLLGVPQL